MTGKIGIITHYYDSLNYGGNLQAYALCRYLTKKGADAEQISFLYQRSFHDTNISLKSMVKCKLFNLIFKKDIETLKKIRTTAFHHFNKELILHSKTVYTDKNIKDCVGEYEIFIAGSDQVWNLEWYNKAFFLDFVPETKKKISYAASIGMGTLEDQHKELFANSLQSFCAISVRENKAIELLSDVVEHEISLVLDPTFLLEREEWEEICEESISDEKYIFAYFLGTNENAKELVQDFAKLHNMKLVYIPYATGLWNRRENIIGDIRIMDASPEKFLSLIKHAEYVVTDSFHAIVFSIIFQKEFVSFNRDEKGSMSSRITSLIEMFDLQDRFCMTKEQETLEYIMGLQKIDYYKKFPKYEECRKKSYEFINKNIIKK